jgi:hypothetical protein
MKRILLLLALLLASPALADDAVTSFGWNSVTGTFQGLTRALGWKTIPDQDNGSFVFCFTTGVPSSQCGTFYYNRVGKHVDLFWGPTSFSANASVSSIATAAGALPTLLTPSRAMIFLVPVTVAGSGSNTPGEILFSTNGSVNFYQNNANTTYSTSIAVTNPGTVLSYETY